MTAEFKLKAVLEALKERSPLAELSDIYKVGASVADDTTTINGQAIKRKKVNHFDREPTTNITH